MTAAREEGPRGIDVATSLAARWTTALLILCLTFVMALLVLEATTRSTTGLRRQVFDASDRAARVTSDMVVPSIRLDTVGPDRLPERMFAARWTGYWVVRRTGTYVVALGADDSAEVRIDGQVVHRRDAEVGFSTIPVRLALAAGVHEIDVWYEQQGGGEFLHLLVGLDGRDPSPLNPRELFPTRADAWKLATNDRLDLAWQHGPPRVLAILIALVALRGIGAWREGARQYCEQSSLRGGWRGLAALVASQRAITAITLAVMVTAVAAALRLDALAARYGVPDGPPWANALARGAPAAVDVVRPAGWSWTAAANPYVGGDPINYLKFSREMTGFYQAHVREPVFLFTTQRFLSALGGQDVAVSYASTFYSTLLVTATFALGLVTFGVATATIAAAAMAVERVAIDWGVDGWRDDASAFFVVLAAATLVRFMKRPTWPWAVVFGVAGAAAALTRITTLLLWLPAVAAFVVLPPRAATAGHRLRLASMSVAVMAALTAPYLVSCARTFGDPLYALNYHTTFYRAREQADASKSMTAAEYVVSKLRDQPARLLDTALYGVAAFPFANKWDGFASWSGVMAHTLRAAALGGLALFAFSWQGRILLGLLVLSVLPFAITWSIPGGGEWRFTLPAYPFYLVAAGLCLTSAASLAARLIRAPREITEVGRGVDRRALAGVAGGATCLAAGLTLLPWLALREAVTKSSAVTVVPDTRDAWIFWSGWRADHGGRCIPADAARPTIRLPLPDDGTFRVTVRLTDVQPAGAGDSPIDVIVGGRRLSRLVLRPTDRNQAADLVIDPSLSGRLTTSVELRSTPAAGPDGDAGAARFAVCAVEIAGLAPDRTTS